MIPPNTLPSVANPDDRSGDDPHEVENLPGPLSATASLESFSGRKGLAVFVLFAVVAVLLSRYTPLGSWLTMEQIRRVAERLGVWGPLVIAAVGIFSPMDLPPVAVPLIIRERPLPL